jgi:hypothetical protein
MEVIIAQKIEFFIYKKVMKTFHYILSIFFAFCQLSSCNSPNKKQIIKRLEKRKETKIIDLNDSKKLLTYLYQSSSFDSQGRIQWSLDEINYPEIPISYDSLFHTEIDTILYFKNLNGTEFGAVILANPRLQSSQGKVKVFDSHGQGISLGVALFSKYNGEWYLYAFEKHLTSLGYFGTYRTGRGDQGKIELRKLGENFTCLSFVQGIGGNTGEFSGNEVWFSIEKNPPEFEHIEEPIEINSRNYAPLHQLFTYNYSHNYYFPDVDNQNVIEIKLNTLKSKSVIYDLMLEIKKYNYNIETDKTNSSNTETKYFSYSKELNIFIEK